MSSEISTERARPDDNLQPWQLFVLAALACATAATFMARGRGLTTVVMVSATMGAAALVGLATLRALWPLVSPEEDRLARIGERTRAALEREKFLVLRSIKELEFDRAMGKLSETDWQEMSTRLRARAGRLIRQLEGSQGYRAQIERDLAKRTGDVPAPAQVAAVPAPAAVVTGARGCGSCATSNDLDAKFCKQCGARL